MFSTVDSLISWFQFNFFIKYFLLTIFPMKKVLTNIQIGPLAQPHSLGYISWWERFWKKYFQDLLFNVFKEMLGYDEIIFIYFNSIITLCMPTFPETLFLLHIHSYVLKIIETKNWSSFLRLSECWDIHLHVDVGNMWIVWLSFKDFL